VQYEKERVCALIVASSRLQLQSNEQGVITMESLFIKRLSSFELSHPNSSFVLAMLIFHLQVVQAITHLQAYYTLQLEKQTTLLYRCIIHVTGIKIGYLLSATQIRKQ